MDIVTYALLKGKVSALEEKVDALQEGLNYGGSVATVGDLPASPAEGDAYTVKANGGLYVYDGTEWVRLNKDLVDKIEAYITNLADDYDTSSHGYEVDNFCIYGDIFYRCIAPVAVGESWTAAHWTRTTVSYELQNPLDLSSITNAQIDALF